MLSTITVMYGSLCCERGYSVLSTEYEFNAQWDFPNLWPKQERVKKSHELYRLTKSCDHSWPVYHCQLQNRCTVSTLCIMCGESMYACTYYVHGVMHINVYKQCNLWCIYCMYLYMYFAYMYVYTVHARCMYYTEQESVCIFMY